jgi:hypothetical protein
MTLYTTSPGDEREELQNCEQHAHGWSRAPADLSDLHAVVRSHCEDLQRCAAMLEKQPGFLATAAEISVAAAELLVALSSSTVQQVGAEWISIHERLPELGQSVALINIDRWENTGGDLEMNVRACGYLHEMRPGDPYWSIRGERATCLDAFTHWLPLPSPKSEQGDQQ